MVHWSKVILKTESRFHCISPLFKVSVTFSKPIIIVSDLRGAFIILCILSFLQISKTDVVNYFNRSLHAHHLPFIPYSIYPIDESAKITDFRVRLQGSLDCILWEKEVEIRFIMEPNTPPRQTVANVNGNKILIICDMYEKDSPFLEAICGRGSHGLELTLDNYECCLLLCEISFHLPNWAQLASLLGFHQQDIDGLRQTFQGKYAFEAAYNMLALWITRSDTFQTFGMLVGVLHQCNLELEKGTWKVNNITCSCTFNVFKEHRLTDLSRKIVFVWKFVGRLVGMKDYEIDEVELDYKQMKVREQAYQMLWVWKRTCVDQNEFHLSEKLFKALHCISDHTGQLRDCLTSFCS